MGANSSSTSGDESSAQPEQERCVNLSIPDTSTDLACPGFPQGLILHVSLLCAMGLQDLTRLTDWLGGAVSPPQRSGATAAVVASHGSSSLDFGTAKDWMSTRLPEVVRLGITPDQLVAQADLSSSTAAPRAAAAVSPISRVPSSAADGEGAAGTQELADSQPDSAEDQIAAVTDAEMEESDAQAAAAAERASYLLDEDLVDELAEGVLGAPDGSPESAAAAQLMGMEASVQERLDGSDHVAADSAASSAADSAPASGRGELDALRPEESVPSVDEVLDAADTVAAAAAASAEQQALEASQHAASCEQSDRLDPSSAEDVLDSAVDTPLMLSKALTAPAATKVKPDSRSMPAADEAVIPSEQLESAIGLISEAVALDTSLAADVSSSIPNTPSTGSQDLPLTGAGGALQTAQLASPEELEKLANAASLENQQELAALRAEVTFQPSLVI